ncbi:OmpW/AlkL family protein [Cupriavidus neocaledonicus]|uniref:Virulence-related OUTER MEMBRANE SIGNAL PEPTIDE PROTEIN, OmpW family n=1 Tax=Cupriavidus neocaledonicus TaxID=1040979 RepID=A0A375HWU4_9BURK|nr:OmpW family outer membrane protein [Cupriavidus neocaledonicus]SOZ37962.1 putative virulence-related OUTER MEMBRANE SIGNAL PEPTIDE PROTEIN, OmpW family [Cupriavidus neocaledonicus]SPD61187.1 putative virulence-related OUTER MEMBRANE SIGNAL PEPTIDE PROTEIN, OmpW family [Cupriavidus neocaledonicus]
MKTLSLRTATCSALAACAMLGAFATPAAAADDAQGNWMVRLRGTYLDMANSSDPVGGAGPSDRITVNNKWIPELDVTYFFTPHIAAELVLTVPQKQNVYLDGNKIGTFKHLPPTLLMQYHFIPNGTFRPYIGAGLNFTRIWGENLANNALQLDSWSVGPALQIGMDYKLTRNWFLNADIKKIWLSSDVKAGDVKVSKVSLDPWLFSFGVGYRF